jgi:hypothetical protein
MFTINMEDDRLRPIDLNHREMRALRFEYDELLSATGSCVVQFDKILKNIKEGKVHLVIDFFDDLVDTGPDGPDSNPIASAKFRRFADFLIKVYMAAEDDFIPGASTIIPGASTEKRIVCDVMSTLYTGV